MVIRSTRMANAYSQKTDVPATDAECLRVFRAATPEWLGVFGERVFETVARASGCYVTPLSRIQNGGAPMMLGNGDAIVLNDLDISKNGITRHLECKAKTRSIVYRNRKQERHGINDSNYRHYMNLESQTGSKLVLGIVELWRERVDSQDELYWSGSLLIQTMANLGNPVDVSLGYERPTKAYWPRKHFSDLDSFSPRELMEICVAQNKLNCSFEFDRLLFGKNTQTELF